jgi:uncharacterized protein (DUF736 family)
MSENNDWKERECGALWRKENNGNIYYSGKITVNGVETQIQIFKNKYKEDGDKKPDLRIYLQETPQS